MNLEIVLVY